MNPSLYDCNTRSQPLPSSPLTKKEAISVCDSRASTERPNKTSGMPRLIKLAPVGLQMPSLLFTSMNIYFVRLCTRYYGQSNKLDRSGLHRVYSLVRREGP